MTPEELNRTMEFIIETQAHLSASLDREHEMRQARLAESEKIQRSLANLQPQVVEMLRTESDRLDRQYDMLRALHHRNDRSGQETAEFEKDVLRLLHQVLDRLRKNPN